MGHVPLFSCPTDFHPPQMFVSSLRGMGLHCKAVCSFQPKQLKVGLSETATHLHCTMDKLVCFVLSLQSRCCPTEVLVVTMFYPCRFRQTWPTPCSSSTA